MVTLKPMNQTQYQQFLDRAIIDFAKDKVDAGTWEEAQSLQKSQDSFKQLLPKGLDTDNEHLFVICAQDSMIGYTWLHLDHLGQKSAFIYDLLILEAFQGQGYGEKMMQALEYKAKEMGCVKLSLHVFAHNERAINLYKKRGFQFRVC
ncbi:GNAT family N-acetyltransferase [Ignatzschineria rhizosphaerae]|uniref:GNAT family N-acetyltransferase n=1 Tax=Ignatzschineria rhizosphaerae TaxID=2923279 RepID=A0ABY3WYC5_9GAMM|nr:GNAT family N-acetyltransferase [Ignatzschineria rhizosphaerae]UNM95608.1 GNAT family N-acetyltransferase [Ignatzschineria rhizosphaerae]